MKIKNLGVSTKITLAIGFAILISMIAGGTGLWVSNDLGNILKEVGDNRLPSLVSLLYISESQTAIDSAENALLSPKLTAQLRQETHKRIRDAWAKVDKYWKIYEPLPQSVEEKKVWDQFVPAWNKWKSDHEEFKKIESEYAANPTNKLYDRLSHQALVSNYISFDKAMELMDKLVEINEKIASDEEVKAEKAIVFARIAIIAVVLIGAFIAFIIGFFIVRGIKNLIETVILSTENLAQAVEQISSGNQNLSQRTSEQASSLEEIASTIEEATATTKQNAENAGEANSLAGNTYKLAEEGGKLSSEAVRGINEINEVSKKISDITNVINEISFQTNLLALNAAVEAARAGEAGRGFAVVAGEIRNLAQRSGNAAKEIGSLIKETIMKIEAGSGLVNKSGESLNKIIDAISTVTRVVNEINAASGEQKSGMDQLTLAVTELDNMTQQNAALVEETASASEEMANQAQELMATTMQFNGGKSNGRSYTSGLKNNIHLKNLEHHPAAVRTGNGKNGHDEVPAKRGGKNGNGEPSHGIHSDPGISHNMKNEGFQEF